MKEKIDKIAKEMLSEYEQCLEKAVVSKHKGDFFLSLKWKTNIDADTRTKCQGFLSSKCDVEGLCEIFDKDKSDEAVWAYKIEPDRPVAQVADCVRRAIAIAFAIVAFASPSYALTETVDGIEWTYTVSDGEASVGGVPRSTYGTITIPSSLGGYPVTGIGNGAFSGRHSLKSVTIPDSVTSIGSYAFNGCSILTNIVIGSCVTNIGDMAFRECICLTSVTIPDSVTSIGTDTFDNCKKLTSVTIPDSVTSIGSSAFKSCSGLTSVTIGNGVTSIGDRAFSYCSKLTAISVAADNPCYKSVSGLLLTKDGKTLVCGVNGDVVIPDGVTSIVDEAFYNCTNLTSVTIPDSVTSIGRSAFYKCSGLTSVTIPNSVTSIGYWAFSYCSGLTNVMIPNSVTSITYCAFSYCSGLTSVTIPDSVTSIGQNAFYNCTNLTSVTIPDSVTSIGSHAFYGCSDSLYDTNSIPGVKLVDGWAVGNTGSLSGNLDLTGVRGIGGSAFDSCSGLTSVTIPDSVTSFGNDTFYNCKNLTSVTIGNGVTNIGVEAFFKCSGLTCVTIPAGVTIDSSAFRGVSPKLRLNVADGTEAFTSSYLANAPAVRSLVGTLVIPSSCRTVDLAALNQLVNLSGVTFCGDSFASASDATLSRLRMSGLDIAYVPEGGTEADGEAVLRERLGNLSSVTITSSAIRTNDASVLDVQYVAAGMTNRFTVRSLAFQDGVRSFANVIRPTSFEDGTATNAYGDVSANEPHVISWRISDNWTVSLGHVAFEVMTVESAELPLKLVKIPTTANHRAIRFSCNALTPARVLDALFWHYADPNCGLTLTNGRLMDGGTLLADGTEPTAAGTAYVFARMGYGLLEGAELEYANSISRLGLVPDGVRQYAVEYPAE